MATPVPLRRRLFAVALVTAATAALAACTIELIDNDDDDGPGGGGGSLDAGFLPDAWGSPIDGTPLDMVASSLDGGAYDAAGAVCGDGIVQPAGGEQCDNGQPGVNTASCDRDCTLPACGDGLANFPAGEQCDTGSASVSCDVDCTAVVCGDGLVNPTAGEQCDDGNAVDTDACRNDCTLP